VKRTLRAFSIAIFAGIFLSSMFGMARAQATYYKYVDKSGTVHFTDRLESIPPEYRSQVKIRKEQVQTPSLPQSQPEKGQGGKGIRPGGEPGVSASIAEGEKGLEAAKAAQEKAQKEKEERARIQQARQAKIKEIDGLLKQIEEKDKEASSLRTNWMVYDKIRLNQLNEEKETLLKQVQTLREELAKMK
jgi:hypothetical protein